MSELIFANYSTEAPSNISDNEVQRELRDSLKRFSIKLGLNDESISSMKNYYQKPSSCIEEYFDKPSTSHATAESSINYPNASNFETGNELIPEKDINIPISYEDDFKDDNIADHPISITCNTDISTNVDENIINESGNNDKCTTEADLKIAQTVYCAEANSSNSEMLMFSSSNSEDNSLEIPIEKEHQDCQATTDNFVNPAINNLEETDNTTREPKKIVYTALEKLNNVKFLNKQETISNMTKPFNLPDLKLKPSESQVIKNNFEVKNKLKKKKNKLKKSSMKDDTFYELERKPGPKVGMDCAFSHVESPNEFYIHLVDEESAFIDVLTEQINEYFQDTVSDYNSKEEASQYLGTYCLAFITDYSGWYRAKIIDWQLEDKSDNVLLQLVDYGNRRMVSYKNLRKMTKELSQCPILAIRCHLPLMYPPNSTNFNRLTEWPAEAIDAMAGLSGLFSTDGQEHKIFKVVYAQDVGESVAIDLYNPKEVNPEQTVGQILLDLGLAVQIVEEPDDENPELNEYLQDIDSLEKADNINEAVAGYDPRDEARICRFTKPDGTCFKGKNCKLEHVPFSKDGFTTDLEPVFMGAMDTLLLPSIGGAFMILITHYKDSCTFFAQIVRTPHKEKMGSLEYVIDQDLYKLLFNMNNAKTEKTYETFKVAPAIGEVVIAKHRHTKKWLRGVVRQHTVWEDESEEFEVFMVDFGEYLQLPLNDLRKIKPYFLELPFQAIECYIHNYKAKRDSDTAKFKHFFYKNIFFQNFVAVAMSSLLPLKVGIKTFNDFDISKVLVDNGFAEERIYDVNPVDGCSLESY
ncbi:hypothetical protein NQ318_000330 [Aromia moschata]|uniref:Tudor domain-containing protein 1 n=1 Tax=Aromia moschata TaxID=1265417 RepID=A0AAV8XSH4_9CUCU|nr:hypothetical protein NQ318_000330 [Aromia moschata]